MIELHAVNRSFSDFNVSVDLTVSEGELLTLFGESGSGKTTVLRLIAGFERPDSGRIMVDGEDVTRLPAERRGIGYVFQDYTLFPHLSVAGNIGYGLRVQGLGKTAQEKRVQEMLELTALTGFGQRKVSHLSGGEQQRVALARALAPHPRALLLDEPFSAIDTERRESLRRHLMNVQRSLRIPTVFVTHSRTEALYLSDRLTIMRDGRIVESGTSEQIYSRPETLYAARFTGSINALTVRQMRRLPEEWAVDGTGATSARRDLPEHAVAAVVRPENLCIGTTDGADGIDGSISLVGYFGSYCLYSVHTDFGDFDVQADSGYAQGDPVKLRPIPGSVRKVAVEVSPS